MIAKGWSVRRVTRTLGINRWRVNRHAGAASKDTPEVINGRAACAARLRRVIAPMIEIGLSVQRIYQDLVAVADYLGWSAVMDSTRQDRVELPDPKIH
jgi:hypothetical protein